MRIAIATPVLFNKSSPFNHIFRDILQGFIDAGFDIVRLVAVRNKDEQEFNLGLQGIEYLKYYRKDADHRNFFMRFLRDTWTNIREARGIKRLKTDVLFEDVSYSSCWAIRAAKKKKMRIVAMLQDVWPDNAVQSGIFKKNGLLYWLFELQQRYVYKNAHRIVCISDDMKEFLVTKGIDESKISVIYNWGYSDEVISIPWSDNLFVKKYDFKNLFYVVYAGNIGRMQNVELIVKSAQKMQDQEDIHFLIIGDGGQKGIIEKKVKSLKNVTLLPLQPHELAQHIYSMANVNVIPLVKEGTKTAMPSKLGVILSCGRKIICCFGRNTRFAKKLLDYEAGLCVSSTDEDELIEAINRIRNEYNDGNKDNFGAQMLFKDYFTRNENVKKYVQNIYSIMEDN